MPRGCGHDGSLATTASPTSPTASCPQTRMCWRGPGADRCQHGGRPDAALFAGRQAPWLTQQAEMMRARNTSDFLPLAIEHYGAVTPALRDLARQVMDEVPLPEASGDPVSAADFPVLAQAEIDWYRQQDPDVVMHAEIRGDVSGVMVSHDTLLVPSGNPCAADRANALLQHEVGTHLVTQVNGSAQQITCLGGGLAGYDETQEGVHARPLPGRSPQQGPRRPLIPDVHRAIRTVPRACRGAPPARLRQNVRVRAIRSRHGTGSDEAARFGGRTVRRACRGALRPAARTTWGPSAGATARPGSSGTVSAVRRPGGPG